MSINNNTATETKYGIGIGIWASLCALISLWVFVRFMNNKQRLVSNLHIVEDSLLKLQEKLELERRKRSIGVVESLDDITEVLEGNRTDNHHSESTIMRHQKVVVNVWKMIYSSCSYLALAFFVWLFLKLAYACFWFPNYLQTQEKESGVETVKTEDEVIAKVSDQGVVVASTSDENKKDV